MHSTWPCASSLYQLDLTRLDRIRNPVDFQLRRRQGIEVLPDVYYPGNIVIIVIVFIPIAVIHGLIRMVGDQSMEIKC